MQTKRSLISETIEKNRDFLSRVNVKEGLMRLTKISCGLRRMVCVAALLLLLLDGSSAGAAPISMSMDVEFMGMRVGSLGVSGYEAGKSGDSATATINGNFTKEPGDAVQTKLEAVAPLGLTFMQTVMFMFDSGKQQKIFRDKNGDNLTGTFSDPPQGGYTLTDGTRQFADDKRPWYSTIAPSGAAGDVPPNSFGANQFRDSPGVPFDPDNGFDGLANLLMGMDGMLKFETALVGVQMQPEDDPMTAADERLTGMYMVQVLKDFMWGMNFHFVDDGVAGFSVADYEVMAKPLMFTTDASDAFRSAFDGGMMEWNVKFVPEPSTAVIMGLGVLALLLRARHRRRAGQRELVYS